MNYDEYAACLKILNTKPGLIGGEDLLKSKLACLETFRSKGTPSEIHALIPFLRDGNEDLRLCAADVIVFLFDKLTSQNQLYDSLKNLSIERSDIGYFSEMFPRDIAIKLLALSSFNGNGYVRQRALEALAEAKHPQAIRFMMFRLGDWVSNIRNVVRTHLQKYFTDEFRRQFISELDVVGGLKKIRRADLTAEYNSILAYILERKIDRAWYDALAVTDKARLLYVKKYVEKYGVDSALATILLSDKAFLIRLCALKHLTQRSLPERNSILLTLLDDTSAHVRLQALYSINGDVADYYHVILKLTSDSSASVRDLARYLLKGQTLDFRTIYKERIQQNYQKIGSVLGLAEVGTADDVELLTALLDTDDTKIRLACLTALQKIDIQKAKVFALQLLVDRPNKIRKRCIDILSHTWGEDVLRETERLYENADAALKITILTLYNKIGGWDVLALLIRAASDSDQQVNQAGWSFLQKWKDKAIRLFTKPPREAIDKAKGYYEGPGVTVADLGRSRKILWEEIRVYLRYD